MREIIIEVKENNLLQDIWYSIEGLLSTKLVEVMNEPTYGSLLYKLDYAPATLENLNKGTLYIRDAISTHITNISSLQITASISNNAFIYNITFNVLDTKVNGTYIKKLY